MTFGARRGALDRLGPSWCRLGCFDGVCHHEMGAATLCSVDGALIWPEGYAHYVTRTRPPKPLADAAAEAAAAAGAGRGRIGRLAAL